MAVLNAGCVTLSRIFEISSLYMGKLCMLEDLYLKIKTKFQKYKTGFAIVEQLSSFPKVWELKSHVLHAQKGIIIV